MNQSRRHRTGFSSDSPATLSRLTLVFVAVCIGMLGVSHASAEDQLNSDDQPRMSSKDFLLMAASPNRSGRRRTGVFRVGRQTKRLQVAYIVDNACIRREEVDQLRVLLPEFLSRSIESHQVERAVAFRGSDGKYQGVSFTPSVSEFRESLEEMKFVDSSRVAETTREPALAGSLWSTVEKAVVSLPWDVDAEDTLRWLIVCGSPTSELSVPEKRELGLGLSELAQKTRAKNVSIVSLVFGAQQSEPPGSDGSERATTGARGKTIRQSLATLSRDTEGSIVDLDSQLSRNYWNGKTQTPFNVAADQSPSDRIDISVNGSDCSESTLRVMEDVLQRLSCNVLDTPQSCPYQLRIAQTTFRGRTEISASLDYKLSEMVEAVTLAEAQEVANSRNVLELQAVADRCMRQLLLSAVDRFSDDTTHQRLRSRIVDHLDQTRTLKSMVANHPQTRTEIMAAIKLLRRSHLEDASTMTRSINLAIAHLISADYYDPGNAFVSLLLANCHFDHAQASCELGKQAAQQRHMRAYTRFIDRAFDACRHQPEDSAIRLAIQAEWHLSCNQFAMAIDSYEKLVKSRQRATADLEVRAMWMLAGLYAGDWGIAHSQEGRELIDMERSQAIVQQLVVRWPNSPEAAYLRKKLRDSARDDEDFHLPLGEQRFATWLSSALNR